MRSPADASSARGLFERGCRALAFIALATGIVMSFRAHRAEQGGGARRVVMVHDSGNVDALADSASDARALQRLAHTVRETHGAAMTGDTTVLPLDALPSPSTRAAIGAMRLAGLPLIWLDSTEARGLALSVTRDASPTGGFNVRVSRTPVQPLALHDVGGLLDSLDAEASETAASTVTGWRIAALTAPVRAAAGSSVAMQSAVDSRSIKRLLVVAQPGWESKFTIAALEESGWPVDGRLRVSPTGVATVGAPERLDTARYAAVVVLDSMEVDASAIRSFVRQGGGLLLSGDALRVPSLAALRPARATELRSATAGALLTATPRRGLEAWELALTADAEAVLRDAGSHGHDEVVVAARRSGAGRVVASAYRQTWRWRMEGTDEGLRDHARWWGRLLALTVPDAAPDSTAATPDAWPGTAAPYADMVALAGAPISMPGAALQTSSPDRGFGARAPAILYVLAALSLLAEWASRRLRGLR